MDFDFGDLDMGSAARSPATELPALELKQSTRPTPPASPKASDDLPSLPALDFSFGDFGPDTGTAASATPSPAPAPIKAADLRNVIPDGSARSNDASSRDRDGAPSGLNVADLKFEFSNVADDLSKAAAAGEPLCLDEELQNFGNDTLDLGTLDTATLGGGGDSGADYVETKLDLASAYLDMGDQVGARSLLEEVIREGQASQRQRAEALLKKLG
jgi:pilus assembly protein FimV